MHHTANGYFNLLAAAGKLRDVRLLHPEQLMCYAELRGHVEEVACLAFHPQRATMLFSGDSKASIMIWDIDIPMLPDLRCHPQMLMRLRCPRPDINPVLNITFVTHYDMLVAGCEDGVFAWRLTDLNLKWW